MTKYLLLPLLCLCAILPARAQDLFVFDDNSIPPGVEESYTKGIRYLLMSQHADGSWSSQQKAGVTGLVLLSLIAHGEDPRYGPHAEAISKGTARLISMANPSNGYIGTSMYNHGFATLALAELYGVVDDERIGPTLEKAVDLIVSSQERNRRGAWRYSPTHQDGDTTVSGAQLVALFAARNAGVDVPDSAIAKGLKFISSCQRSDGSIGYTGPGDSSPPRSAIGALVFHLQKDKDSTSGQSAYRFLQSYGLNAHGGSYHFYFLYYAAQAHFHANIREWQKWNATNIKQLVATQSADGSWNMGSHGPEFSTASALLSMALNYRYLPIYER